MSVLVAITLFLAALAGISLLAFLLVPVVCAIGAACLDHGELQQ